MAKQHTPQGGAGTDLATGAIASTDNVPKERARFRSLIVANPNYFGNIEKSPFSPVAPMQGKMLKALRGELHWFRAADILGWSPRTLRRWRERYETHGHSGLINRRLLRPSRRRVPAPILWKEVLTTSRPRRVLRLAGRNAQENSHPLHFRRQLASEDTVARRR